jgi:hypothetical protein
MLNVAHSPPEAYLHDRNLLQVTIGIYELGLEVLQEIFHFFLLEYCSIGGFISNKDEIFIDG